MNWVLIIIGVVAVLVVSKLLHFKHFKHKLTAIALILLALFIYSTFNAVIKSNHIDIKTSSGIISASKIYFSWLVHAFDNMKVLTGSVIKMEWMPKNITISG